MKDITLRSIVHDTAITLIAGVLLAAGLAVVLFLAGLLIRGFDLRSAFVIVRGGLLVCGALELFVCAGLLLLNKDSRKVRDYGLWRKHFQAFGLLPVLMLTSVLILSAGSIVDYYLYF